MILNLTYGNLSLLRVVTINYDDVSHAITGNSVGSMPIPSGLGAGAEFYRQTVGVDNWILKVSNSAPYATVTHFVDITATVVITNVTRFGGTNGALNVTPSGGSSPYTYVWGDGPTTQNRTGLAAGFYSCTITDAGGNTLVISRTVTQPPMLVVTGSRTNVSTIGGSDGTATLIISGGSGTNVVSWADSAVTSIARIDLPAGHYVGTVVDTITGELVTVIMDITEPIGPVVRAGTLLEVPLLNSLKFVVDPVTPDNCATMQTHDNVLFTDQYFPGYEEVDYLQKVQICDTFPIQWNTDYPAHVVELRDKCTDALIKQFPAELVTKWIDNAVQYDVLISADIVAGKSRVTFTTKALPIAIEIGDAFTIEANTEGFNGDYLVTDIQTDAVTGYQYLIINIAYVGAAGLTSAAKGDFLYSAEDFNVWQATADFSDVPEGEYYVTILATDSFGHTQGAVSEPIELRTLHLDTTFVKAKNFDDGFGDISWSTGFFSQYRIPAVFQKRLPGGERTTSRGARYQLIKLSAKKSRITQLEMFALPPYLLEILSVVWDCDYFEVNGVSHQSSEAQGDPTYQEMYKLGDAIVKLEQVDWFRKYNSNDIGDGTIIQSDRIFSGEFGPEFG